MNLCQYPNCTFKLRKDNKAGYCQTHYSYSPLMKSYNKTWNDKHRDKTKQRAKETRVYRDSTFSKYGITATDFHNMNTVQSGLCAICREPPKYGVNRLSVDHCHETGKVRGLLCRDCNSGLGHFQDNEMNLAIALRYLRAAKK